MTEATATALLSDIGATNARFALLAEGQRLDTTTYAVADYASPVEAAREFLAGPAAGHKPQIAVLAAAGPVVNGRVTMTNAAWTVDAERIRQGLGLQAVHVINDFEAQGWALPGYRPADLVEIGHVTPPDEGTMVVMGPGSGFGLAGLARDGDEVARGIFAEAGKYLGMALAILVNVFNLPLYVIGGGVVSGWDLFAPRMFEELRRLSYIYCLTEPEKDLPFTAGKTYVVPAATGPDAGLLGAAMLPYLEAGLL